MRNSIVLLELLASLILFSFLAISSSKMMLVLIEENKNETAIVEQNLILETTRLFIQKHNDLSQYSLENNNLYFQNNLLLENISLYKIIQQNSLHNIEICIKNNTVCQLWKIRI